MLEELFKQIPKNLLKESGEVFYSGKNAFSGKKKIYILGINPGGSVENHINDTIEKQAKNAIRFSKRNPNWSEYKDGQWEGKSPGTHVFQIRMNHLLKNLNLSPYYIPASNLVFVRSAREGNFNKSLYKEYAKLCWNNFHEKVINKLEIKIIICLGNTPGNFVRKKLKMGNDLIDSFAEKNKRKWQTKIYQNEKKQKVIIIPHPSISDWTTKECDPTKKLLKHI
ncbi:MAG: hypothetical protein ACK452_01640 [Bacteroidota bacterium]|jgi:hypothetical protein